MYIGLQMVLMYFCCYLTWPAGVFKNVIHHIQIYEMAGEEGDGQNGFIIDSARLSLDVTTEEDDEVVDEDDESDQVVAKTLSSHSKEVDMILKSARAVQAIAVDLSGKGLVNIPEELYGMDHVEVSTCMAEVP